MWRRSIAWSSLTAAVLLLNLSSYVLAQTDGDDPYNIIKFNDLRLSNNPDALCRYLKCLSPVKSCPDGTLWMENVAMYGCCGGCVRFKERNEKDCTGSIDPQFGDGYCDIKDGKVACPNRPLLFRAEKSLELSFNASLKAASDTDDGNIIVSSWCAYGLQCFDFNEGNPTRPNRQCSAPVIPGDDASRTCAQARLSLEAYTNSYEYDEMRDDYLWIPECTLEGLYQPKQCKGPVDEQRCVCVDPYGKSIYGAAFPFQEELFDSMNCECSRRVWELKQDGIESPTLHCQENGNYEPIQCENGYCYCIDPNTTLTYGPTVPEKAMFILPCYNKTLLGENDKYMRRCDSKYHAHSSLRDFLVAKGVGDPPLSSMSCDPDGSFSGMQCVGTKCDCYDKIGNKYSISATSTDSGCNCKRDTELLDSLNQHATLICRGQHGGYYKYHSDANGAYCMDEHGIRSSPKMKPEYCELLQCNSAAFCQDGLTGQDGSSNYCNQACVDCPQCVYASYQGDMSECEDYEMSNIECTDINYGNE